MNKTNIKNLTLTALGIACVFAGTYFVKIDNGTGGYLHLGDGFIMLFSSILSPLGGFMVGGVASAMADLVGGYPHYIIPTLIIKGLEGYMISFLFSKYGLKIKYIAYFLGSIIMVFGYFLAKWYMKQNIYIALAGIIENCFQSGFGVIIALILLNRINHIKNK